MAGKKEAEVETCDVVDKFGNRTGRTVTRGTKLGNGEYYLIVHVWIRDENHNLLIQRRALHVVSDPGIWATTVGYVRAGEESSAGAIREVNEELGIQLASLNPTETIGPSRDGRSPGRHMVGRGFAGPDR